jgi:hypothetical protein
LGWSGQLSSGQVEAGTTIVYTHPSDDELRRGVKSLGF